MTELPPCPRLIALDLDGTLLDSAHALRERAVAAVRALVDRGVLCVLASGRMYRDAVQPHWERLGLWTPVICYNGALILDPTQGTSLAERPLTPAWTRALLDYAAGDRTLNLYLDDRLYVRRPSPWTDLYTARTGSRPIFRDDLADWFAGRASTKALLLGEPATIAREAVEWRERAGGELYVTITEPEYLEFMHPGANKGWALEQVAAELGVPLPETAAFGDALNDLPLLRAAGYAVAMSNARPELQAVADLIAPSCDDDGVARILERWAAA